MLVRCKGKIAGAFDHTHQVVKNYNLPGVAACATWLFATGELGFAALVASTSVGEVAHDWVEDAALVE